MDFLKKHYEKVLLGVVLLGLAVAVAFLPFKIASDKQALEDKRNQLIHPQRQAVNQPGPDGTGDRAEAVEPLPSWLISPRPTNCSIRCRGRKPRTGI